jgi:hypothetical protein
MAACDCELIQPGCTLTCRIRFEIERDRSVSYLMVVNLGQAR